MNKNISAKGGSASGGKKILLIEDEKSLWEALRDKLEREGFEVVIASDGEKGFKAITETNPDLILLDLMLPKMSGEEVLKKMNENGLIKKIPVIILSAKGDEGSINNSLNALGATDYLIKPNWKLADVVKKVRQRLKK